MSIVDMVKDKKVKFTRYKNNELWYMTENGFEFPVPISDIGEATYFAEDKAPLFMRYIKAHMLLIKAGMAEQS